MHIYSCTPLDTHSVLPPTHTSLASLLWSTHTLFQPLPISPLSYTCLGSWHTVQRWNYALKLLPIIQNMVCMGCRVCTISATATAAFSECPAGQSQGERQGRLLLRTVLLLLWSAMGGLGEQVIGSHCWHCCFYGLSEHFHTDECSCRLQPLNWSTSSFPPRSIAAASQEQMAKGRKKGKGIILFSS